MSHFFANQPFFRFAAVATLTTEYPRDQELMAWVMSVLKVRIAEIFSRSQASSVALVFEASQRADPLVMEYFGALELEEEGQKIPVEYFLLPKSAGAPALEADFVMHAVGRMARHRLKGKQGIPADFDAVFRRCHPDLTSFMLVDRIERRTGKMMDEAIGVGLGFPGGAPTQCSPTRSISFSTG